jgi:NAD(P)-dependent dehydrogenase (short-subunit alcohol dehydrogenase family)
MRDVTVPDALPESGSSLEGRVAIITGAGRGIGRQHALLFAREGAAVVVNDLGGDNTGEGADASLAREVVDEIVAAGGRAVANTDSVADWNNAKGVVQQAIDEFGRLDVLINNAGILRDSFIAGMHESQWDAVIAVHLKGHFAMLRHAAEYWKARSKAGERPTAAVVNTASGSGTTIPNAGQANYGSAKAAIAALTLIAAEELERYGVRVNAIAPIARTRLTLATPGMGTLMDEPEPGEVDLFSPANISPLVAYLATEKCRITGRVYAVAGGAISQLSGWHDVDTIETDGVWSIDDIAARLPN